ncbi:hypothetical protein [Streptomyces sp. NPDC054783]
MTSSRVPPAPALPALPAPPSATGKAAGTEYGFGHRTITVAPGKEFSLTVRSAATLESFDFTALAQGRATVRLLLTATPRARAGFYVFTITVR